MCIDWAFRCTDDWDTAGCRRATCECDRGLAIALRASDYDEKYHRNQGFSPLEICKPIESIDENDLSEECCGQYEDDGSRQFYDITNKRWCIFVESENIPKN